MRTPGATYRLQLHAGFTLHDALAVLPYLHDLGITDLYLSPIFEARPGSTHGYDVVDPTRVGAALGGRAALEALADAARARGMGVMLDIVPNHMAASELSPWWRDVLQHGRASRYAGFFDIDWGDDPAAGRLLLPVLGAELEEAIARDELRPVRDAAGEWGLDYFGRVLPLRIDDAAQTALRRYPDAEPEERRRIIGDVVARQHYELAHWQTATIRLGYRRFFDITDLAGVRVEEPAVFEATHALVTELVAEGRVSALRVDHVDGLRAPTAYLHRLRERTGAFTVVEKILERAEPLPAWPVAGTTGYDFLNLLNGLFMEPAGHARIVAAYHRITADPRSFADIVHEKKHLVMGDLFGGELRSLAAQLVSVLDDRISADAAACAIAELTACMPVYRTYTEDLTVSEADRAALAHAFRECEQRAPGLDPDLRAALHAILHLEESLGERRGAALDFVLRWQQFSGPVMAKGFEDTALYIWAPLLSANEVGSGPAAPITSVAEFHERMRERARRWPHAQGTTATHDTKRGEDVRARLNVLTELPDEWATRLRAWARRSVDQKEEALEQVGLADDAPVPNAKEENLLYQTLVGAWPLEHDAATVDDEFAGRVQEYMTKALREGKESTSWHGPDQDYETALTAFVERLLSAPRRPSLRREIGSFATRIAWYGALNALSQTLLKITAPGFPDFYQGTELWSLVLVDPDNRRPVDYGVRRAALGALEPLLASPSAEGLQPLLHAWRDGSLKLFTTTAALRFRRARRALFEQGTYLPLEAHGARAEHVVAFARQLGSECAITIAPRFYTRLCAPGALPAEQWEDTVLLLPAELAGARWRDAFTGREVAAGGAVALRSVLADFPVALLGQVRPG